MDESLQAKLIQLAGDNAFIGEVVRAPRLSQIMWPDEYTCTVRPTQLNEKGLQAGKQGYLLLRSGETLSIRVVGIAMLTPTMDAIRSDGWDPSDCTFSFRSSDSPEKQMQKAYLFVQPR